MSDVRCVMSDFLQFVKYLNIAHIRHQKIRHLTSSLMPNFLQFVKYQVIAHVRHQKIRHQTFLLVFFSRKYFPLHAFPKAGEGFILVTIFFPVIAKGFYLFVAGFFGYIKKGSDSFCIHLLR